MARRAFVCARVTRRFSTFLDSSSWSIASLSNRSESIPVSQAELRDCAALCKLSSNIPESIIHDVQRVIAYARSISEVDCSPSQYRSLSEYEKQTQEIQGMVSPITHPFECRNKDSDKYASQWVMESVRENSRNTKRLDGSNLFVVPKVKPDEIE